MRFAKWPIAAAMAITVIGRLYFGVMTSDDAFITYRYAANIVHQHAFVYNPGERVLGTSTPLYTLVMSAVVAAGLPVEAASFAIGTACDALVVLVLYLLLADAGFRRAAAAAAAMAGAVPLAIVPASAGMETPLYLLLLLLTFREAALASETGRTVRLTTLVCALGACRPDGAIAAAIALGGVAMQRPRVAVRAVVPVAIAAAIVATAMFGYFGSIVPQSVVAKAAAKQPAWAGPQLLAALLLARGHFVTTALAVVGSAVLWRAQRAWRWLLVWWAAYATTFTATGAFLHADWYFVPLQPVYWGCVAVGIETIAPRVVAERHAHLVAGLATLALVAVALGGWPGHRAAFAQVQSIRERPYLDAARRIAASDLPCNLAAPEIGAIGYGFPGRIIDLGGIVTPSAVLRPAAVVIEEQQAQWLVSQNIYMPEGLLADPSFTTNFARVASLPLEPGRTLDTYKRRGGSCRN